MCQNAVSFRVCVCVCVFLPVHDLLKSISCLNLYIFCLLLIFIDAMRCFHLNKHVSIMSMVKISLKFHLMTSSLRVFFSPFSFSLSLSSLLYLHPQCLNPQCEMQNIILKSEPNHLNQVENVQMFQMLCISGKLSYFQDVAKWDATQLIFCRQNCGTEIREL